MSPTGKAGKARNKPPELKGKTQHERFVETAKSLGVDESGAVFERAIKAVTAARKLPAVAPKKSRDS